jgi:hypothetical protein
MLIYFIVVQAKDNNQVDSPPRAMLELWLKSFLEDAERLGIVVVVMAGDGDQVVTVILMRVSALYELTI